MGWRIQTHDCASFWGWKRKFNTTAISASKNRPLFFSKSKLVQNIGLRGSSRLAAARLQKTTWQGTFKIWKKCVCLLKGSQGRRAEFSRISLFSLWNDLTSGCIAFTRTPSMSAPVRTSLIIPQLLLPTATANNERSAFPASRTKAPQSQARELQRRTGPAQLFSTFCKCIHLRLASILTCLWFKAAAATDNSKLTVPNGLFHMGHEILSAWSMREAYHQCYINYSDAVVLQQMKNIYIYEFRQNIHLILLPPYIYLALISVITTTLMTESHGKQSKQVFTADFTVALEEEDPEVDSQASLTQTHGLKLQRMEARNICPSDDH